MAISLLFGLSSVRYQIGAFSHAGPGLFPALVSGLLFLIGLITAIRARMVAGKPLDLHVKNIAVIIGGLCGFAVVSMFVNMIAGIVFMVFVAAAAGSTYSWKRNAKVAVGLVLMAFFFSRLLGMNLPLY